MNLASINYSTATFIQQPRKPITIRRVLRKWFSKKVKSHKETPLPCFMYHYEEFSSYIPQHYPRDNTQTSLRMYFT